MVDDLTGPLKRLDEKALLRLLGEAWYDQFKPDLGHGYYLGTALEIGQREFYTLAPMLRIALAGAKAEGRVAAVARVIRSCGTWRMPATVVTTLALMKGFGAASGYHDASGAARSELHAQGPSPRS